MSKYGKTKKQHTNHRYFQSHYHGFKSLQAHLHDRKNGYGPIEKGVRTSHFFLFKQSVPCFGGWVRTRVISGFGAIEAPKPEINTGSYSFLNSYVSLCNDFTNDMCSKKKLCGSGDKNVFSECFICELDQALLRCRCQTDLSTVQ